MEVILIIMKVLLVEDDKFLRTVLEKKLVNEGFDVVVAEDGESALQKLVQERPGIILLDIVLPKRSGFAVLEEIRKDPEFSSLPIIILSNLGQKEDVEKGLSLGAVDYFVKAKISLDELLKKVKEYSGQKELVR
jgi:DNA-binding response OmpR family regulator